MPADDPVIEHYEAPDPIDLRASLASLGIEHLEVTDEQTIVIYRRSVLNVQVTDGTLTAATAIDVELFDPPNTGGSDPASIIERFLDEITSVSSPPDR